MLSDNIRNYRKAHNMSQDELAEKIDVSRQSISLWETGQTQPSIDKIIALARVFNISSDALLGNADGTYEDTADNTYEIISDSKAESYTASKKRKNLIIIIGIIAAAVIIGCILFFVLSSKNGKDGNNAGDTTVSQSESSTDNAVSDMTDSGTVAENTSGNNNSAGNNTVTQSKGTTVNGNSDKTGSGVVNSTAAGVNNVTSTPVVTEKPQEVKTFDLFSYCKDFAIKKGTLNGDYCIYQQPASLYGGYNNEYVSISYWGDSDMVEFCLHCPLDETFSINFYLRMRGGYNHKYEYLSSRYYRDNGESLRSATGYIDPAVFSDKYPLSCDKYVGSADGQNEFMEESRVGICDLIRCIKYFVDVENMECDFSDFEFVNF